MFHSGNNQTRRDFLSGVAGSTAIVAAGLSFPGKLNSSEVDPSGWIDAHVHVWTPDTKKYPLSGKFTKADMQPTSFTADELLSYCRPSNVQRIVLIQMSFYEYDHSYMLEVMNAHPGVFSGVALIDYRARDVAKKVEELSKLGMRGFRIHSQGDIAEWRDSPGMHTLWQTAGELGLAVCPLINPADLPVVDALCQKYTNTTVVVDHFARIGVSGSIDSKHLENLCKLARFPKAHVKTSAFYALGKKTAPYYDLIPMIKKVHGHFGAERLMWASDCPFQVQDGHNYDASIALVRDHLDFLSEKDKQWMLRGTAEKLFFV